jgi:hypothetical protein
MSIGGVHHHMSSSESFLLSLHGVIILIPQRMGQAFSCLDHGLRLLAGELVVGPHYTKISYVKSTLTPKVQVSKSLYDLLRGII